MERDSRIISYAENREHKDSVFRDLFGAEENKANALSLYNALNGSSYDDPSVIQITTLENVLYMSVKNDVSFLIGEELVLWEHQSTHNPNMPLRALNYFTHLYNEWVHDNDYSVYSDERVPLPRPRYAVFYIGSIERPEGETMRLSDSFMGSRDHHDGDADALEVITTVYNINVGYNNELMEKCSALEGYSRLIWTIRQGREQGMDVSEAVEWALDRCIAEGTLADYLSRRRAEVKDYILTEYDEADTMRRLKKHYTEVALARGREEGLAEGREEGLAEFLDKAAAAVRDGVLSIDAAATAFGFSREEIEARLYSGRAFVYTHARRRSEGDVLPHHGHR